MLLIFNTALDGLSLYPPDQLGLESETRKEKMLKDVCCRSDSNIQVQNIDFKMVTMIFKLITTKQVFLHSNKLFDHVKNSKIAIPRFLSGVLLAEVNK